MRKIMVVGCGRSGTLYMSKVFAAMGLDVKHEKLGKDGISSWFHSFGNRQKMLIQNQMKEDERIYIHLIRNPIAVINSMVRVSQLKRRRALQYFKDLCPDDTEGIYDDYSLAMFYWVFWNRMIEKRGAGVDIRIKVEDVIQRESYQKLCDVIGHKYDFANLLKIRGISDKTHEIKGSDFNNILKEQPDLKYTKNFDDLVNINYGLAKKVMYLSNEYGYNLGV